MIAKTNVNLFIVLSFKFSAKLHLFSNICKKKVRFTTNNRHFWRCFGKIFAKKGLRWGNFATRGRCPGWCGYG